MFNLALIVLTLYQEKKTQVKNVLLFLDTVRPMDIVMLLRLQEVMNFLKPNYFSKEFERHDEIIVTARFNLLFIELHEFYDI